MSLSEETDLSGVREMVEEAGRLSLQWYRASLDDHGGIENKNADRAVSGHGPSGFDPVTVADRAVEDHLRDSLATLGPAAVLGEERGTTGDGDYCWVIDPIDGTKAFITGQPMWGTLLGLLHKGRPIAGWMYLPALDESYWATPEGSGYHSPMFGTRPLGVRSTTSLSEATLLVTHPSMFEGPREPQYEELLNAVRLSRFSGDCMNYALLATGTADLCVEDQLQVYDIVPLLPILEASGAVVTNLQGKAPLEGGFVVAATTPELHAATTAFFPA